MKLPYVLAMLSLSFVAVAAASPSSEPTFASPLDSGAEDVVPQPTEDTQDNLPYHHPEILVHEEEEPPQQRRLRHLKKNNKNNKNKNKNQGRSGQGIGGGVGVVVEIHPCIPFEQIRDGQINDPWGNADRTCATNSCGGGCCRAYNWLLCDTRNAFPYVACVCNENTQDPNYFVRSPFY